MQRVITMKKLYLLLIFLTVSASVGFADVNRTGMRDLAVEQMYEYGQMLYERGDYHQAERVFERILSFDPQHAGSLHYMKSMDPSKVIAHAPSVMATSKPCCVIAKNEPNPAEVPVVSNDPNADLKEEIAARQKDLDKLKQDVQVLQDETGSSK